MYICSLFVTINHMQVQSSVQQVQHNPAVRDEQLAQRFYDTFNVQADISCCHSDLTTSSLSKGVGLYKGQVMPDQGFWVDKIGKISLSRPVDSSGIFSKFYQYFFSKESSISAITETKKVLPTFKTPLQDIVDHFVMTTPTEKAVLVGTVAGTALLVHKALALPSQQQLALIRTRQEFDRERQRQIYNQCMLLALKVRPGFKTLIEKGCKHIVDKQLQLEDKYRAASDKKKAPTLQEVLKDFGEAQKKQQNNPHKTKSHDTNSKS